LKVAKVLAAPGYDYPAAIQESVAEGFVNVSHSITSFAASNLKGTSLPAPSVTAPATALPRTLPHALARGAAAAATPLDATSPLGKGLSEYSTTFDKIGAARLTQDAAIHDGFVRPWGNTLDNSISLAMKARLAVRTSRLELDAAKQALKTAAPAKQQQARLEVENAEDDLVQKTEVAITLMKAVLENPEPIKNLNELVKAQLTFHATAAELLTTLSGETEELSVAAEAEYRKSRDH